MLIKLLFPSMKCWKETKYPTKWDCKIESYSVLKNHVAED